jgi:hypothetical protein
MEADRGLPGFGRRPMVCGTLIWSGEVIVKHVVLLLATLIACSLPGPSLAQSDERTYCRQLVELYRRYVQNSPGRRSDVEATLALEACRKGDPEGIPVLEKKLRENHIAVPGGEFKP